MLQEWKASSSRVEGSASREETIRWDFLGLGISRNKARREKGKNSRWILKATEEKGTYQIIGGGRDAGRGHLEHKGTGSHVNAGGKELVGDKEHMLPQIHQ